MSIRYNSKTKENYFEKIYIGTGPILLLDAINENIKGKKILLIDSGEKIGGSWKLLNLFGLKDLENAVHYLVPNKIGYEFLEEEFKINLSTNYKRYYAIKFFKKAILLSTNKFYGKILNYLINSFFEKRFSIKRLLKSLSLNSSTSKSKYPIEGCKSFIKKIEKLKDEVNLKIMLNTLLKEIEIDDSKYSKLTTSKGILFTKKLIISHGFIPPNKIKIFKEKIFLEKKIHLRPSLHIIYTISKPKEAKSNLNSFSQVLFNKESSIKYAHELTQYIERSKSQKNTYAIVVALKHHIRNEFTTYERVLKELREFNLIPESKFIKKINFFWQDIKLPVLYTEDLNYIKKKSNQKIDFMLTEEINYSLGIYSKRWDKLKDLLKKIF
tara:strand:+ start:210 stop:1355 length:1146 start_codon:yes stop_codon:yes gene_type:complete